MISDRDAWAGLASRGVYFAVHGSPDILFGSFLGRAGSEALLEARGLTVEEAERIAGAVRAADFPHGAVFDIEILRALLSRVDPGGASGSMVALARIKLPGTDGMRGKTRDADVRPREALRLFLDGGVVTPAFLGLAARAIGSECLENGLIGRGEPVVVGSDGRDTSGLFPAAVDAAFAGLGFTVLDAGVLATPGVPLFAQHAGCRLGAIVTASHNPSNQNGIKFIHDGFKLANDGPAGELGLTARMFRLADRDDPPVPAGRIRDVHEAATDLLYRIDVENAGVTPRHLADVRIVYDGANGAYAPVAVRVLSALGADFIAVNVDPRGHNINQGGGVGEIEGHRFFEGRVLPEVFAGYLPTVRLMFDEGRIAAGRRVFGIVNDGDGDRGYLLVYSPRSDTVHVVPGDEVAFWIARGRRDEGSLGPSPVCVNSVESDIMAGLAMTRVLGIESETACVGDKNLLKPAREGRNHIVGCEESGHVTFGVPVADTTGRAGMVYTGNGLLSVLRAIAVIQGRGASLEEAVNPFAPGIKDSRCVYFVDKARFFRGSEVWKEDETIATDLLDRLLPRGWSTRVVDFADDPQMLYVACAGPENVTEGALFVRNSGTETKTVATLRCTDRIAPAMREAMLAVHRRNRVLMKDAGNPDAEVERNLLEVIGDRALRRHEAKAGVEARMGRTVTETDFAAVLFAMRKEGLLEETGTTLRRADDERL